ncbi:hypothetical protein E4U54_008645, partial [Claviceps lovelessii]
MPEKSRDRPEPNRITIKAAWTGRPSQMSSANGGRRHGRSSYHGDHPVRWTAEPEPPPDSLSYPGDDEVHSSPRRTTSRRQRRPSSSRTIDQRDYSALRRMPLPPGAGASLTRAATAAYRRPVNCLAPAEQYHGSRHRHSASESSPVYGKAKVMMRGGGGGSGGEYSRQSSVESGLGYGHVGRHTHEYDDDEDDHDHDHDHDDYDNDDYDHDQNDHHHHHHHDYDDHDAGNQIEVIEDVDEELPRYRERRRQPSRDEYGDSSSGTRYHRPRRRAYADEDTDSRRPYTASDGASAAYASSRTPDQSVESRQGRHNHHRMDVIEDSRPPISSSS